MKKPKVFSKSFSVVFIGIIIFLCLGCKTEVPIVEATVPVLITNVSNITLTGADVYGKVTSTGGSDIISKGIYWGTNEDNLTGIISNIATSSDSFAIKMTGLTPSTTYYVRAYATNSAGKGLGNIKSFKTPVDASLVEDTPGFGPFTTILAHANLQPPASWNSSFPLSDQTNTGKWVKNPSFSDEFNTPTLNTTNWASDNTGLGFNQGNDPTLLNPTTTGMEFHMRKGPPTGDYQYRGSWVGSKAKLLYGYIEASIDMA
ncbi:MAG: hypothetical protein PHR83_18820, partial [Paludibacter sp.]|nr:hypothetical protein [Paludibacter sp.]